MSRTLGRPDYVLIGLIAVTLGFGLLMLASAGTVVAFEQYGDAGYFVKRQLFAVAVGLVALVFLSRIDYHVWRRMAFVFLVITIVLLVLVLVPQLSEGAQGARRWLYLGPYSFQPSELAKLTFLLYLGMWLEKRGQGVQSFEYGLAPFLTLLGIIAGLIILEPNFSTMSVIVAISVVMFFVAGARAKHLLWIIGGAAAAALVLIKLAPYRAARFTVFLNPDLDPQGIGYHINQALLAVGSGGLWGLGLGHSRQKFNFLPEVTGDSIFAVIAEELGFIFSVGIILLFLAIMLRGLKIARSAPDLFGKLVATGITVWFIVQALFNISAMIGLAPLTGIPLPFISHGGTAVSIALAAVGILINISRQATGREAPTPRWR